LYARERKFASKPFRAVARALAEVGAADVVRLPRFHANGEAVTPESRRIAQSEKFVMS